MKKVMFMFVLGFLLLGKSDYNVNAKVKNVDLYCNTGGIAGYSANYYAIKGEKVSLYVGQEVQLNVVNKLDGMGWKWETSTKEVGSITSKGLIKIKKTGVFRATGSCYFNNHIYKINYSVYTKKPYLPKNSVLLKKNQSFKAVIVGATGKKYISSNKKVVKCDKNGNINALKKGKTTIIIKDKNNKKYKLKVKVTNTKNKKHYNSKLKSKKGKVIIRFNKLKGTNWGSKVVSTRNSFLKKTTEDYYYAKDSLGRIIVITVSQKPLIDTYKVYGKKVSIKPSTLIGPLGLFKGKVGFYYDLFDDYYFYPSVKTDQGVFYYDDISYRYGSDSTELEGETFREMELMTMKMKGKYITLYTYKLDINGSINTNSSLNVKKVAKKLFN